MSAILGVIFIPVNLIYIIIYLNNNHLADWLYKMIIVSNFSFVIFSLSFISIYLARIHKNLLGKPIYVIDKDRCINLIFSCFIIFFICFSISITLSFIPRLELSFYFY